VREWAADYLQVLHTFDERRITEGTDDDENRQTEWNDVFRGEFGHFQDQSHCHECGVGDGQSEIVFPGAQNTDSAKQDNHKTGEYQHRMIVFKLGFPQIFARKHQKYWSDYNQNIGND